MANDDKNKLIFVTCPSCNSLVPALSTRCRMCGASLEASSENKKDEQPVRESRVRQKTMTISETMKDKIVEQFSEPIDSEDLENPFATEEVEDDIPEMPVSEIDNNDPLSSLIEEKEVNDDIFDMSNIQDESDKNFQPQETTNDISDNNIFLKEESQEEIVQITSKEISQKKSLEEKTPDVEVPEQKKDFFEGLDDDIFSQDLDLESDLGDLFDDINKEENVPIEEDELYPSDTMKKEQVHETNNQENIFLDFKTDDHGNNDNKKNVDITPEFDMLNDNQQNQEIDLLDTEENKKDIIENKNPQKLTQKIEVPHDVQVVYEENILKEDNNLNTKKGSDTFFEKDNANKKFSSQSNNNSHKLFSTKETASNKYINTEQKENKERLNEPKKSNNLLLNKKTEQHKLTFKDSYENKKNKMENKDDVQKNNNENINRRESKIEQKVENKIENTKKESNTVVSKDILGRLMGWLVSFKDPKGTAFEVREGKFFVTSSSLKESDFIIDDESISTPHALVTISNSNGILIQDLMSDLGIYLKEAGQNEYIKKETSFKVHHGDRVKFGNVEYVVCLVSHVGE